MTTIDELLDDSETAKALSVSRGTLANWRCSKLGGPPFVKIGALVRYRARDVQEYIESRVIQPLDTSKPAARG